MSKDVEREVLVEAPVQTVWSAVTEPGQLVQWWCDAAQVDLRPGGTGVLVWDDKASNQRATAAIQIETLDAPRRFAFRWGQPAGETAGPGNSILVEFGLTAEGDGTRVRISESGLADLDWPDEEKATYLEQHEHGWDIHLARLDKYVATRMP